MNLENKSVLELLYLLKAKKISAVELTKYYIDRIKKFNYKNAVLEIFDDALLQAEKCDLIINTKNMLPKLIGIPVLIKDNILYKGKISSSGSKMLENYVAEYNSTVVQKLLDEGAIILGRTNMDEFAMGGSCENSAYGPCKNAYDDTKVSGGSSGGSAVAVALDMCAFSLGSDTGGSVRQPASFNGIVGLKPTYGRISRYGLCAFASSLDTVGIFTKDVKDNAFLLSILAGDDKFDGTSKKAKVDNYIDYLSDNINGKKIAIIKEVQELVKKTKYYNIYQKVLNYCQNHGAILTEVSIKNYTKVLPVYYTIAPAEGSSNMGRFDGVKYTSNVKDCKNINEIYSKTRSKFLGKEVKRRIMLGNFVLSSEQYSSYYLKAKNISIMLKKEFEKIFMQNDIVFMPTTYGEAFDIGSKTQDPVSMYIEDMFTVTANIVGIPAISIPIGVGENGLPLGLQVLSAELNEKELYCMANFVFLHRSEI